jgi:hypothetical protein
MVRESHLFQCGGGEAWRGKRGLPAGFDLVSGSCWALSTTMVPATHVAYHRHHLLPLLAGLSRRRAMPQQDVLALVVSVAAAVVA